MTDAIGDLSIRNIPGALPPEQKFSEDDKTGKTCTTAHEENQDENDNPFAAIGMTAGNVRRAAVILQQGSKTSL